MADEILARAGIHIDEVNRLRLLHPEVAETCSELHSESKDFSSQMTSFQTTTEALMQTLEDLAGLVEAERLRAMTSRTALKAADKQRMADTQQVQILFRERQVEMERLRSELAAVQLIEKEQKDQLQQIMNS